MATTTTIAGLPVPEETDTPDVPRDILALAQAIEKRLVVVYASTADRGVKNTSPQEGMVAYLSDSNRIEIYIDGAWTAYPPTQPAITSGTAVPSNSSGANGDVFLKV